MSKPPPRDSMEAPPPSWEVRASIPVGEINDNEAITRKVLDASNNAAPRERHRLARWQIILIVGFITLGLTAVVLALNTPAPAPAANAAPAPPTPVAKPQEASPAPPAPPAPAATPARSAEDEPIPKTARLPISARPSEAKLSSVRRERRAEKSRPAQAESQPRGALPSATPAPGSGAEPGMYLERSPARTGSRQMDERSPYEP